MTPFIIFTLAILFFYFLGFARKSSKSKFFDRDYVTQIKGFSILTVVWAHGSARLGIGGIQFIAGVGVALFLICSGYGLEKSYEKNGFSRFWRKRLLKICIPLWIIEFLWESIQQTLTVKNFVVNAFLLESGGWYIRYILICYVIFYFVKVFSQKLTLKENQEKRILFIVFGLFFVYECIWPWLEATPFLRARQMFSFPVGVLLASQRDMIEERLNNKRIQRILVACCLGTGMLFMGVTQIELIKNMNVFVNNLLSIFTVLPLAIGVLALTKMFQRLLQNNFLYYIGIISYEMFLVQNYTQQYIENATTSICLFLLSTILFSLILRGLIKLVEIVCRKSKNVSI